MTRTTRSRRGSARTLATATGALLALGSVPTAFADTTTRLEATDNVEASLAWSQLTFADGTATEAILARDDVFADSLASGAAQGLLGAPLLLTNPAVLDPRVTAELERLGVERVTILGGEAAIDPAQEAQLTAFGYETRRFRGATRVETAIALAEGLFPNTASVVVARAFVPDDSSDATQAFADSLATGAYAAAAQVPVIYTDTAALPEASRTYLQDSAIQEIVVAGGAGAVSDAVISELEGFDLEDLAVRRVSGPTRFETAVEMATDLGFASAGASDRVLLVEGTSENSWASGFPAAIQAAGSGAPLLLSSGTELPGPTADFLSDAGGRIPLVCGPFVSAEACEAASTAVGNS